MSNRVATLSTKFHNNGNAVIQVNSTTNLKEVSLTPSKDLTTQPLAPQNVHLIKEKDLVLEDCDEDKCSVSSEVKWYGQENCTFGIICSKLSDNPCGDYGLEVEIDGDDDKVDKICHAKQLQTYILATGDKAKISLWYTGNFTSQVTCYYWCTPSGEIPAKPKSERLDKDVLNDLVKLRFQNPSWLTLLWRFKIVS